MEINIRDDQKIIEIWLSKAERDDPGLSNTLRKLCVEYGPRKYTVAVFKSGEEDLCDLTRPAAHQSAQAGRAGGGE